MLTPASQPGPENSPLSPTSVRGAGSPLRSCEPERRQLRVIGPQDRLDDFAVRRFEPPLIGGYGVVNARLQRELGCEERLKQTIAPLRLVREKRQVERFQELAGEICIAMSLPQRGQRQMAFQRKRTCFARGDRQQLLPRERCAAHWLRCFRFF
jgi:hypothetical protein